MAERAHPEDRGFQDRWLGLKKNPYKQKLLERYAFCNPHIQSKRIVDVPCGVGWGTSLLKGYRRAWGVDVSAESVEYGKQHYEKKGKLEFVKGDMAKLPLEDDSVDVVICLEGFEHVSQEIGASFVQEAMRVLPRDGLLLMTCPVLNEYGKDTGNPHHVYEYPEAELIEILNTNFRVLVLERVRGPEGPEYRTVVQNLKGRRYLSK